MMALSEVKKHPVLFLSRSGAIDGAQRQLLHLATGMDREMFPLTVAVDGPGALAEELRALGVDTRVYPMRPWRTLLKVPWRWADARRLRKLGRSCGAKVVHAHDVWRAEYARSVARGLGVPYMVHVRGPLSARDIKKHRLAEADGVIAIAQRYVEDLKATGVAAEKIALIDDGVDVGLFQPGTAAGETWRKELGLGEGLVVGLVGRVSPFKKVREFVEMAGLLTAGQGAAGGATFVVIGEWAEADYQHQVEAEVRQRGLERQVRFIGRCAGSRMPAALAGLDVLATLSGGSVMFEAMACGVPVFSMRGDGRHSLHTRHGETAWCATTEQVKEGAAVLGALLEDEALRQRLGEEGRKWVREHLATEVMVRKTEAVYGRVGRIADC